MTGHLEEISPYLDFSKSAWANPQGQGHSGWEELPYWLKDYGDLGYVLGDEAIIANAKKWLKAAMANQREDGYFGPRDLLTSLDKQFPDMWPQMLMLNALQSYYEYSGDRQVIDVMTRYFHWQDGLSPECFGKGYWPRVRMSDNIESIHWLYNRMGDAFLLGLWVPPLHPQPGIHATASHLNDQDTPDALSDGVSGKNSADQSILRFTWWDHRGTPEWVQYDFDGPRKLAAASVQWFDDTGSRNCRVPQSWRLLYKDGGDWKSVQTGANAYGVQPDVWNRVEFSPVETTALRLEVQLPPGESGGILEWKVE